jgi:hypothetical protein
MIRSYFEGEEWPHREKSTAYGPGPGPFVGLLGKDMSNDHMISCVVDHGVSRKESFIMGSCCVVSLGLAIPFLMIWMVMDRRQLLPRVTVTAYPAGPGVSRVTVVSEKEPEYALPVAAWIESELVQKKRAT